MQKIQSAPDRRWAKDVAPGDEIRALYLIGSASQLQAKNGPFWRIELKDASGDLEARIWSPLSQQFAEIPSGVIAEVEGRAESFRDKLQVNVNALRVLSPEAKGEILSDLSETELPLLESGVIDPMVDRVFPLERVREAHEYFDSGEHRGKVVLRLA